MSTRERLPNRRASTIFDFEAMGMRFTASASRYDDGRFAELFSTITRLEARSEHWSATAQSS